MMIKLQNHWPRSTSQETSVRSMTRLSNKPSLLFLTRSQPPHRRVFYPRLYLSLTRFSSCVLKATVPITWPQPRGRDWLICELKKIVPVEYLDWFDLRTIWITEYRNKSPPFFHRTLIRPARHWSAGKSSTLIKFIQFIYYFQSFYFLIKSQRDVIWSILFRNCREDDVKVKSTMVSSTTS